MLWLIYDSAEKVQLFLNTITKTPSRNVSTQSFGDGFQIQDSLF